MVDPVEDLRGRSNEQIDPMEDLERSIQWKSRSYKTLPIKLEQDFFHFLPVLNDFIT